MRIRDRALETLSRRREIEHRIHRSELKALDGERARIAERASAIVRNLKLLQERSLSSRNTSTQLRGPEHVRWLDEQSKAARELSKEKHLCQINLSNVADRASVLQHSIRSIEKQQQVIHNEQIARQARRLDQYAETELEESITLRAALSEGLSGSEGRNRLLVDSIATDRDAESVFPREHIADFSIAGVPSIQIQECSSTNQGNWSAPPTSDSDKHNHGMSNRESEHQHAHFTYTDERGNAHDVSIALDEQIQVAVDIRTRGEAGDVAHNRERLRHSLINAGISVTDVVITQKR